MAHTQTHIQQTKASINQYKPTIFYMNNCVLQTVIPLHTVIRYTVIALVATHGYSIAHDYSVAHGSRGLDSLG